MRGVKPKLVVLQGGRVSGKCPVAPSWLAKHAKSEWKRVAPQLHGRGLLTSDTLATLESYCVAAGMVRETEETMQAEGRTIESDKGPKAHPAFRIQSAAMREVRLLAAELGLTPHRRGKSDAQGDAADGWDADLLT